MSDWEFPELKGPAVFIGSSNDVSDLRNIVKEEFKKLRRELADLRGVEYYAWEDEKFELGWDHNRPFQASIPLTSDINCRAAIFIFGECIGAPLPAHFPRTELAGSPALEESTPHSLEPAGPSPANKAFPLTGTVFEYLVAQTKPDLPIKVLFFADQSIEKEDKVSKQAWGLRRLKKAMQRDFGEENEDEFFEWRQSEYLPELGRLRNFHRYVTRDCNTPVDVVDNQDEFGRLVREFLVSALDVKPPEQAPFKYLEAYDENDGGSFFGRQSIREHIVQNLVQTVRAPTADRRPFYCIYGASGAGKSSVLRAGVVAHMAHSVSEGKWVTCTIRPSELDDGQDPLLNLHRACMGAIEAIKERPIPKLNLTDVVAECRAANALEDIKLALNQLPGSDEKARWRFLLGIDQLEEAVSELLDSPEGHEKWQHFLEFINIATMSGRVAVVSSVPQSWFAEMMRDARLKSLVESGDSKPIGFPIHQVEGIIECSFRLVVPSLSNALKKKLLKSITELYATSKGDDAGAMLPLLSLAMSRIYERWKERTSDNAAPETNVEAPDAVTDHESDFLETLEQDVIAQFEESAEDPNELTLDDYGDLAELESIIDDQGEKAFEQAKAASGASFVEEEGLPVLLRPMVTLLKGDEIALRNAARPLDRSASALLDALCANRLISSVEDNKYRLVHERVLRHWSRAAEWKESERRVLAFVRGLSDRLSDWQADGRDWRDPATLNRLGVDDKEGAAEVLYAWSTTLAPVRGTASVDADYAELRDVLAAILTHQGTPRERIDGLKSHPTHFHAAVASAANDLVTSYLAADSDAVHLKRESDNRTALFDAAFYDRTEVLQTLIDAGASPLKPDKDNWYPLHAAAARGRMGAAKLLLEAGKEVDLLGGSDGDVSPLNTACSNGHIDLAKFFLEQDANPNQPNSKAWTPLHRAAREDNTELVKLLLEHGADPSFITKAGWSSFLLACRNGTAKTVRLFLENKKTNRMETTGHWSPLELAVFGGNPDSLRVLLSDKALDRDHKKPGKQNLLQLAIAEQRPELLVPLLDDDQIDINATDSDESTAMHLAAKEGCLQALEVLLANDAAVDIKNKFGDCPLHEAVKAHHLQAARLIVEAVPDQIDIPNRNNDTALHLATTLRRRAMVQMLMEHGAKLPQPDSMGLSAVHHAARQKDTSILALLLASAPELIGARDAFGQTPLHHAARQGLFNQMELMINRGPGILFERDDKGLTAFHLAIKYNRLKSARYLLRLSADLLSRADQNGWLPLHTAAQYGHTDAVEWLLNEGQDANAVSRRPELALLHIAAEQDDPHLVDLGCNHQADLNQTTAGRPTPLAVALTNGSIHAAMRLIERGAKVDDTKDASALLSTYVNKLSQSQSALPDEDTMRRLAGFGIRVTQSTTLQRDLWPVPEHVKPIEPSDTSTIVETKQSRSMALFENYAWRELSAGQLADIAPRLDPVDGKHKFDAHSVTGQVAPLPWYDQVQLLRFTNPAWVPTQLTLYYLVDDGNLFRLNGTSPSIHEVNAKAPIQLSAENVEEYLRFFCFFVRGEEGPFYILESMDDPFVDVEMDATTRSVFEGTIRPMTLEGIDKEGRFLCDGVLWYSNAMFIANFAVESTGMIHMLDDEPIAADLPIRVDRPIA